MEALKQEIKKDEETIAGYRDVRNSLKVVGDYFRMRADKYQILGTIHSLREPFSSAGMCRRRSCRQSKKRLEIIMTV